MFTAVLIMNVHTLTKLCTAQKELRNTRILECPPDSAHEVAVMSVMDFKNSK